MSLARKCVAVALLGGVVSWAAGCVVKEETTPPVTNPWPFPDQNSFCAALGQRLCNDTVVQDCYDSAPAQLAADKADCAEAVAAASHCNPDNFPYHPEQAEACLGAMEQMWADATVDMDEIEATEEACVSVFYEGRAAGQPCSFDTQCDTASGLECVVKLGDADGICGHIDWIQGGSGCEGTEAICVETHYCDAELDFNCIERPNIGEQCSLTMPCKQDGSGAGWCDSSVEPWICQPKLGNSEPCELDEQCLYGFCNLLSGQTSGTCGGVMDLDSGSASCDQFTD